jgi:hypothetical protein
MLLTFHRRRGILGISSIQYGRIPPFQTQCKRRLNETGKDVIIHISPSSPVVELFLVQILPPFILFHLRTELLML